MVWDDQMMCVHSNICELEETVSCFRIVMLNLVYKF